MKPSDTTSILRQIASNIEKSKNPDKSAVAKDLQKLVAAINPETMDPATMSTLTPSQLASQLTNGFSEGRENVAGAVTMIMDYGKSTSMHQSDIDAAVICAIGSLTGQL
jgi:hypothetical protein